ncbi:hypothetical protein [Rhizobium sp. L1K21]|uniref:hypothetical protein n=1 Tax=Rhizobium sp. L1K21 TaxID=2954933 RepID=UPI002093CD49|nr:hypothetical protein [Rhizobium sp. L1K21]MCO6188360.1 hypothetical protein [Rhizobium sp. L1K21]
MTAQMAEKTAAETAPALRIYQPYLDAGQKARLASDAIAFDISFNTAPNAREYELFKALWETEKSANPRDFWGLVSSKFELKSPIGFQQFREAAQKAMQEGFDCYLINPMIGLSALYENGKEHAELGGHPGLEPLYAKLGEMGLPVSAPQNHRTFFYCNYVVGNHRFWTGYFAFCDAVVAKFENEAKSGTPVGKVYAGNGNYGRDESASMRPFLIERLIGFYLKIAETKGLKVAAYRPTVEDFDAKFGVRLGRKLERLFRAKEAFVATGDERLRNAWLSNRHAVMENAPLVWIMDDPPNWLL